MPKLIAGNWKMFKGPIDTLAFFDSFEAPDGVDVVLCPPFVSLEAAVGEEWPIYAQNVHWADEGAFTGEISAQMLLELGVQGTLVGHSERRGGVGGAAPPGGGRPPGARAGGGAGVAGGGGA
ncbi:MAG: triose-phosphate isomerase, partial [Thermoleophilia bacterium]|nr:triose-phosphate isomerase [Thermoleophilia bacterium]